MTHILIKNSPRQFFCQQRKSLSPKNRHTLAQQASRHLYSLHSRLPKQAKVGIYYDGFGELPTQVILDWCIRLGYHCYLPVVGTLGKQRKCLRFSRITHHKLTHQPTYTHKLGMQQPYNKNLLWATQLDIIFCPLVAVDLQGSRMGMGGGYYDTTLANVYKFGLKKPLKIGWCYDFQIVEKLTRQPWDVPLDGLITPSQIKWFNR